ncbi:hypothetical protein Tco_1059072, partial [Tanacetum coccineum]
MNVFMRIGFGSTIKLVSFDESQVVTFNGKVVSGFKNSDRGTGSQSDNTVGNPHGFIIHWIVILKNIKKVTEYGVLLRSWLFDIDSSKRVVFMLGEGLGRIVMREMGRYGVSVPTLTKRPQRKQDQYAVLEIMDDPNITMEEYIRLEEEKAQRRAIVFNDTLTSEATLSCEPMVSSLKNDEIDFRISFDKSNDEDFTITFDKNSFSCKIISVNDLKTDSENDNDKVNMSLLPSPDPTVSYFDDLYYFKDFEKEFSAIVYNDAQTSKLDFLTEPTLSPQHIDKFDLKDETLLSECDKEEQNVLYFNDLFYFNIIYPDDSKSDEDNHDDKIDIEHSSGDLSVKPLPNVINNDVGAYAHGSNKLLKT